MGEAVKKISKEKKSVSVTYQCYSSGVPQIEM